MQAHSTTEPLSRESIINIFIFFIISRERIQIACQTPAMGLDPTFFYCIHFYPLLPIYCDPR